MSEPVESVRERLVQAAFDLFDEAGFDATTVDDIARRAGVGRTTFFRHFGSKEAAVFPEHDPLLDRIAQRLASAAPATRDVAVAEASGLVLRHYLDEGERARLRYRLVGSVPALRDREIAGQHRYERLFADALRERWPDDPDADLRAELMAAAVVTAHNHVLRRWLRGETTTPDLDLDRALALVTRQSSSERATTTSVVVVESTLDPQTLADRVRSALK